MQNRLHFSELRYRRLFETAQDGILILDAKSGKIDDVNPFLSKLLGYSKEELVGKQLWQIGIFKDIAQSQAAFKELQKKEYIRYKDLPLVTKDGRSIEVEFVSNVYLVGTDKVIQCNIRDISDRRKAELAVEKSKQAMLNVMEDLEDAKSVIGLEKARDEAMLASIGEGIVAVDRQGKIMVMNSVAENMLGWEMQDLLGKPITGLILEDEAGNMIPFDKRPTTMALSTGKIAKVSYYFVKKDKTRFPIAITATPIHLGATTIGLIEIIRDISKEQEIDKAKSEFVSLASHQLRTPLGIIKWYLEALENEEYFKKSPEKIKDYFTEIRKSNERVLSLVRDLLSISRIEQGKVKNFPKLVDSVQVVSEIVEQMQILAVKKKVMLKLQIIDNNIPNITIDVFQFHEVVENLIVNAIEYSFTRGAVEVTLARISDTLVIKVKDSGIGISKNDQDKLFTKFYRSEKATGYNPEGSGLGLYVVKSYVEAWGGKISVESVEAKGSTFTISIPMKGGDKDEKNSTH